MPRRKYGIKHFKRMQKLGEGTYGIVYKAMHASTKNVVALKKIRADDDEEGISSTTIREIALLKELAHPNIVKLHDILIESNEFYLVFEFCSNDLKKHMNKFKYKISSKQKKKYLYQMCDAIAYCHSKRIFHRDLKPQNILINEATDTVKIADFGLARTFCLPNRTWTHEVITLWYRPPEILLGCRTYSVYVDVWSIGCIFAEMLNNSVPLFRGDSEISQLMHIFRIIGTPNKENWPMVHKLRNFNKSFPKWRAKSLDRIIPNTCNLGKDIFSRMVVLNPEKRISAKMALKHPYFDEIQTNK